MPECLVVQHVEPEHPYAIGDALAHAGIQLTICRVFEGAVVPKTLAGFDGLVVMGGPMSAKSDDGFPTRAAEIALLKQTLALEVPVLGICLGAQLLVLSAGGEVVEGANGLEIGWRPVELTEEAADDPILGGLPRELEVLHWHGDTFTLPVGAVHLARSGSYEQQAFRCGKCAWGLQFHVEVDAVAVEEFVRCFGADAFSAGTSPDTIRALTPDAVAKLEPWRTEIVTRFATLVAQREQDIPD